MSCIEYFYKLLSRQDYSVSELTRKGKEKGFDLNEIADAINEVQDKGYQSDSRLVSSLISSSQGKYGKSRVKRKCLEKGISADIFEEIWQSQTENEEAEPLDSLKSKVMRKYKIADFRNIDPKTKGKLWNFLQYRGFNPSQVLQQWLQEEDNVPFN